MARIGNTRDLLKNSRPGAVIGSFDGKVGATILEGDFFITSANQTVIFAPPLGERRQVKLRADSRYGDDDPVLWPQPYIPSYCHFGAIPHRSSLPTHEIIWWTPTRESFVSYQSASSLIQGLGKLSFLEFKLLKTSVDYLLGRVIAYEATTPQERRPLNLRPLVKWLEHGLLQLQSVYVTFRQMEFVVRDVQRIWLDLWALLDYMEIYKPRMDGHASPAVDVADTIGVFTDSTRVAHDFFIAGLPCWLIRPSSQFTNQIIVRVDDLIRPEGRLILDSHRFPYPVIFTGPASSLEKYSHVYQYSRNFFRSPDPFGGAATQQVSPMLPALPSPSVVGPNAQSQPTRSEHRGLKLKPKNSDVTGGRRKNPQATSNRNKFLPVTTSSIALVPIDSWSTALAAVDQNPARVDVRYQTPHDRKYIFPEPGIFISTNEMRRARYFATWQAIEGACVYRLLSSSTSTPLSNQEWRDILIGDIASKTPTAKSALAREHAHRLLGSAIDDMGITVNDTSPAVAPASLSDAEAQQILWRLTELNFRFELIALDKRVGPANRDEMERQETIQDCLQVRSMLVADPEDAKSGLQSDDWRSRFPCLLKFQSLMRDWVGVKPSALFDTFPESSKESDVLLLEHAITRFYTDSFFRYFGRAAIIPARLS